MSSLVIGPNLSNIRISILSKLKSEEKFGVPCKLLVVYKDSILWEMGHYGLKCYRFAKDLRKIRLAHLLYESIGYGDLHEKVNG